MPFVNDWIHFVYEESWTSEVLQLKPNQGMIVHLQLKLEAIWKTGTILGAAAIWLAWGIWDAVVINDQTDAAIKC